MVIQWLTRALQRATILCGRLHIAVCDVGGGAGLWCSNLHATCMQLDWLCSWVLNMQEQRIQACIPSNNIDQTHMLRDYTQLRELQCS
jgi:hypothetical protein